MQRSQFIDFLCRLLLAMLTIAIVGACRDPDPKGSPGGSSGPRGRELPSLSIRADTPNLLLTWIDRDGDFHVVQKPEEVPTDARDQVRVVVSNQLEGTGDLVYVANLNQVTPEETYQTKTMTRAAWDELGARRRKSRLEALAPSSASAAPSGSPAQAIVAVIYGAAWCNPCHEAERYLKRRGIGVVMKDIEANPTAAKEMNQKLERAGKRGASIPVIDIMGQLLVGYSPSQIDRAVQAAQRARPL